MLEGVLIALRSSPATVRRASDIGRSASRGLGTRYAHVAYCDDSRNLNAQGEPFDVAVKFPREKESGLQCRVREIILFDRNENGLEPMAISKWSAVVRARARASERGCGLLALFTRDPWER